MHNIFGSIGGLAGASATIQVDFRTADGRPLPYATVKGKGPEPEKHPLFTNHDTVMGDVRIVPLPGKRVEHQGIKVQLVGQIELAAERNAVRSNPHDFVSLARDLSPPGELMQQALLPFEFKNVEMEYDSYRGQQVRLRYLLRVTIARAYGGSMVQDVQLWVRNYEEPIEEVTPPIKMEVGIEDCLHIEFEYNKGRYHLRDTVVGKIYFLLVRIKLKHMELEIRRREVTGTGGAKRTEVETLGKYEIMDGAPVRGESIPIRLYLSPYETTPTYRNVHNKFSVSYLLNLVLVDEEDRRYFKQQEIVLYRLADSAQARPQKGAPPPSLDGPTPSETTIGAAPLDGA